MHLGYIYDMHLQARCRNCFATSSGLITLPLILGAAIFLSVGAFVAMQLYTSKNAKGNIPSQSRPAVSQQVATSPLASQSPVATPQAVADKQSFSPNKSFSANKVQQKTSSTVPNPTTNASPATSTIPKLIFGIGPEADVARDSALNKAVPLGMYSSWYNGPNDLQWMQLWKANFIPQIYASGRAVHLIIFSDIPENGSPCGRQYPISEQINGDMVKLAEIFAGKASDKPLYVTLFTEFQTYPCQDNQWQGSEEYYTRLQTKVREIQAIFKQYAPNAKVSLGWGGWQAKWDDPANGGGRSLFPHFDSLSRTLDFQSFQLMERESNVNDSLAMAKILSAYGPVMIAHHKPNGFYPDRFSQDITGIFTDSHMAQLTQNKVFAYSIMDDKEISSSQSIFNQVKTAIVKYGRMP